MMRMEWGVRSPSSLNSTLKHTFISKKQLGANLQSDYIYRNSVRLRLQEQQ